MKLVEIDWLTVSSALHHHQKTGAPIPFNTSFHPATDAPDLIRPLDAPYSFKRWLPLILRTRTLTTPSPSPTNPETTTPCGPCPPLQTITLPRPLARLLLTATEASLLNQQINRLYREDLADEIAPLLERGLIFPPEGLFLRLDACSPKDGAGPLALRSVADVLLKFVTSVRTRNALLHLLEAGEDGGDDGRVCEMFFLPFDVRMAGDREYRVFCRPGDGKVTGVSQYAWNRPWRFSRWGDVEEVVDRVLERVLKGVEEVRGMILEEVKGEEDGLLLKQGFSFDLFFDEETEACSLVELNTFGVRSGCGSCLFHWVDDRRVLYGEEEAEFRVVTEVHRHLQCSWSLETLLSGGDGVGLSQIISNYWATE